MLILSLFYLYLYVAIDIFIFIYIAILCSYLVCNYLYQNSHLYKAFEPCCIIHNQLIELILLKVIDSMHASGRTSLH